MKPRSACDFRRRSLMSWIPLLVVPFVLAVGLAVTRAVSQKVWLLVIAAIVFAEIVLVGKPSPSWESKHLISLWAVGIFLPWGIAAIFVAYMPYQRKPLLTALGMPVVYFVSLVIRLAVGDSLGLIPQ